MPKIHTFTMNEYIPIGEGYASVLQTDVGRDTPNVLSKAEILSL